MWKWIGGILLAVLFILVGASWYGYRTMTAGGDSASVTIAGTPERVFASLANHDSLAIWWMLRNGNASEEHGPLKAGDSLPAQTSRSNGRRRRMTWRTTEVVPSKLLVLSLRDDSTGAVLAMRRDSLVSLGDSTMIVSTLASPMLDSLRGGSEEKSPGKAGGAILDMSSKLLVSGMRMQSKVELTRLKNHIEGRPDALVRP